MKETPIIMSGDHPAKILAGVKTQTRRILAPQPEHSKFAEEYKDNRTVPYTIWQFSDSPIGTEHAGFTMVRCPYGRPGDRLYVREAGVLSLPYSPDQKGPWWTFKDGSQKKQAGSYWPTPNPRTDEWWKKQNHKLTPSIHMPRWASRILLEIEAVRVERVQAISEEDAVAEGILKKWDDSVKGLEGWHCIPGGFDTAVRAYAWLWDLINAKRDGGIYSWAKNPWVWALMFRRIDDSEASTLAD
jgi:hypothetical protein